MALGWWSSSEEEEEPREKCFVDYDSAVTEDLKEHIKENCSKIEECYGDIKAQKEKFNLLKSQLAEYDEYVQLITDNVSPPEYFVNPSSFQFMNNVDLSKPIEKQTLNDAYKLSHYYFSGETGRAADKEYVFLGFGDATDEAIKRELDSGKYDKNSPDNIFKSILYLTTSANIVKASDDIDSDQKQKIDELQELLGSLAEIVGAPDSQQGARKCAEELWSIEQKQKIIASDALSDAIQNRGEFDDMSPEERVQARENLINEIGPKTGATTPLLREIPKEFKEQCAMLALIFQLSQIHQAHTAGVDDVGVDPMDFTAAMLRSIQEQTSKKLPYEAGDDGDNSSLLVDGRPYAFINKLTQYGSMVNFFEATNAQLAHLQPTIRLFRVAPDGNSEIETEFAFDTFARKSDVSSIFDRKDKRGFGVGLQNFTFKYEGSNPFSVKKSIRASLTITANNFSELLDDSRGYRYIDLALKTGKAIKEKTQSKELDFRIKAIVGLSVPDAEVTANFDDIRAAVQNNYVTLNLTPVTHTFDFDETGAVKFNIEYYAYIEEFFDKARMNIFADTKINKRVISRELGIRTQKKNCVDKDDVEILNKFIENDAAQLKKDKIQSLQFLTTELLVNDLVYYLNLSKSEFDDLVSAGPFFEFKDIKQKITTDGSITSESISKDLEEAFNKKFDSAKDKDKKGLKNSFKISGIDNRQIPFFFLGDLIDIVLEKIGKNLDSISDLPEVYIGDGGAQLEIDPELIEQEKEILVNSKTQFKKFRLVLGPVEIVNHKNVGQVSRVSMADIPVSLAYFNEWLTSKVLAKDSATYPLTQFLNDLVNNLVRNFLNDDSCYDFNIKQKTRLFQSTVTSYRQPEQDKDDISTLINSSEIGRLTKRLNIDLLDDSQRPVLNIGGHRMLAPSNLGPENENHFFIFYAGRSAPPELLKGERSQDQKNGVFHYIMGRDRGIVKTIKLNKTDSPGLKEVRFEQEGYQGLYQLREIYDVNIETFCNIHAFPGTYIFVEPRGFSPSLGQFKIDEFDLTDLGIGGYYMIISSEHDFGPGKMNTSITAKWVQSLDSEEESKQKQYSSGAGSGGAEVKKCGVKTQ